MESKSTKFFICYLDKPDNKNHEKGMRKQTLELIPRTGMQSSALSARNIYVKL